MNDTLARFEQRINSLLKEKKVLASDIECLRERLALSSKLSADQRKSEGRSVSVEGELRGDNRNYSMPLRGLNEDY